jgi:hypothetical protein
MLETEKISRKGSSLTRTTAYSNLFFIWFFFSVASKGWNVNRLLLSCFL